MGKLSELVMASPLLAELGYLSFKPNRGVLDADMGSLFTESNLNSTFCEQKRLKMSTPPKTNYFFLHFLS